MSQHHDDQHQPAHLVLADGSRFSGYRIGAPGGTVGEVVFTTGMTGYQEVLTDPSYCGQLVTMTAPEIGNTGVNDEDQETRAPVLAGFIVHELSSCASNWRSVATLDDYLKRHGIVGLAGIDTRALTRHIRDQGAQMAAIGSEDIATLHDRAVSAEPMQGRDLTGQVTTSQSYEWTQGSGDWALGDASERRFHVVAVDYGIKHNILRCLVDEGCRVTVVPATATADEILARDPDGVFLSNGPGDPDAVTHGIEMVQTLLGKRPIFGICLGHQILSLALGGTRFKQKFGHRGLNQPVKDLSTGRIEITTQNHGFCIETPGQCEVTHIHLNDNSCEGVRHKEAAAFGVQYHPEASAGPHDARYLFKRFTDLIEAHR